MRRWLIPFFVLLLAGLACTLPADQTPTPVPPTPFDGGIIQPPAAAVKAQNDLAAKLGITAETITISQISSMEWNNTCLDAPGIDEICEPQLIKGYEVQMTTAGGTYTYHTDAEGDILRQLNHVANPSTAALQSRALLAGMLGYDPADIFIVKDDPVRFKDSCLEVSTPEMACAQVQVRGFRIDLEVNGLIFEFHSAENPINPVLAKAGTVTGNQLVVMLSRDGGINQYCDNLNITLAGKVIQYTCLGMPGEVPGIMDLSPQDQAKLLKWVLKFSPFDTRQTRQDQVAFHLTFTGIGDQETQFTDQQEIRQFAESLMRSLQPFATPLPTVGPQG